jgi:hypothetical protein
VRGRFSNRKDHVSHGGLPSPRAVRRDEAKSGVRKRVDRLCMAVHPDPRRKVTIDGKAFRPVCDRPAGHIVRHRTRTAAGYIWW